MGTNSNLAILTVKNLTDITPIYESIHFILEALVSSPLLIEVLTIPYPV